MSKKRQTVFGMSTEEADETRRGSGNIALVSLHAGYSHSSLALHSILAFSALEPFYTRMRCFESLVNVNHQPLLERLFAFKPSVIGFSTYLWNIQASLRLARLLKQLLPECLIVLGGPEAGPRGRELLQNESAVDYVVEGEGEAAFRDLVRLLLYGEGDPGAISGLCFRRDDGIRVNPVQPLAVESIPAPVSAGTMTFYKPLVYWETSRGCPFRCSFCSSATDRLRAFPMERIEADLKVLEGLRNKTVKLLDRSFHLGRVRTIGLLRRFASTPSGLRFHLELNPDRISDEAIAIFGEAEHGKFQFEIGLQSLQEPVLNAIDRQMQVPKALETIRRLIALHRHPVHLDLIVGLPGEDASQCADSLDRVFLLYPDHLQLGTLKLLPGTPLREQAERFGYRWDRSPPYEVLGHSRLSFEELSRFKRHAELLERFWNSGYLRTTLAGLVNRCFGDSLSDCFEVLLQEVGPGLATENLHPEHLFERVAASVGKRVSEWPELGEWLLWDYGHFSLPNNRTPAWIADRLGRGERIDMAGTRRRVPVLQLSQAAIGLINRLSGETRPAGAYAVWPMQYEKGKPVRVIPLESTAEDA